MASLALAIGVLVLAVTQPTATEDIARGRLAECPSSPNCVSSQADPSDERHYIEALPAGGDAAATLERLREIIAGMERTEIVTAQPGYIHAEFTSRILQVNDRTVCCITDHCLQATVNQILSLVDHWRQCSCVSDGRLAAVRR